MKLLYNYNLLTKGGRHIPCNRAMLPPEPSSTTTAHRVQTPIQTTRSLNLTYVELHLNMYVLTTSI